MKLGYDCHNCGYKVGFKCTMKGHIDIKTVTLEIFWCKNQIHYSRDINKLEDILAHKEKNPYFRTGKKSPYLLGINLWDPGGSSLPSFLPHQSDMKQSEQGN